MTSKVYTLYLSTLVTAPVNNLIVPLNKTNLANVTWMIDFNNLFKGDNNKFRRCTVRHKLISTKWAGVDADWEAYSGILCCNLPSMFSSSTNNGTILNLLNPQTVSTGGAFHCYISNTLGYQTGVDINMPSGVYPVTFSFYNDDALTFINNPNAPDWQMIMQFELSDPIQDLVLLDKYGSTF